MTNLQKRRFRFWLWLIQIIGVIVPRRIRADWQLEWEAELQHREQLLTDWDRLNWTGKLDLFRRSTSAFWDALWLQPKRLEEEMFQDLHFGVRMLLKNKGFTAVATLSLALGIGANTAIFQLIDAVRLRTLPVRAPNELVQVRPVEMKGARGGFARSFPTVTNPLWEQIRDRQQSFSGIFAWGADTANLAPGGEERPARMLYVSGDFFSTLGVQAALGRTLTATDDQRGCGTPGVVISNGFWQREYGQDANIVGQKITVNDHPLEIVGVAQANFFGMEVGRSFDLALPICAVSLVRGNDRLLSGTMWWLTVTGRLKPGWTSEQATSHVQSISPGVFEAALPANYPSASVNDYLATKLTAAPAGAGISTLREEYQQSLWLLLAIAASVLLVACANLANLLLARASARERELAIRHALGASRLRIIRQLLVESLLLATAGALFGAALAQALSRFLVSFLSTGTNPVFLDLTPDWRVFAFTIGLAFLTCLFFGLAPALRATRRHTGSLIKTIGRGLTASRERFNLRRALVVVQVALSLVLVTGALLFSRSLGKLLTVDTGFEREGILTARILFQRSNLPQDQIPIFKNSLLERIRAIPGVESAAVAHELPLRDWGGASAWMDGQNATQAKDTSLSRIGSEYFKTLKIAMLSGRDFDSRDTVDSPKVAIVNEAFAREFLGGRNPVGQRFWIAATPGSPDTPYEIVGLVRNTKYEELREEFGPIAYYASAQDAGAGPGTQVLIRSRLSQAETVAAIKRALNEISPTISVRFEGFKSMIEATILRERLLATLSFFFGLLALLLACIGLYGSLSYGVASRTNEIGIRMAIGAQRRDVFWLILRESILLVMAGVLLGLPIVFAVTRLAASLLFGLTPTDPLSLLLSSLLMLLVAVVAGYLPSRRATRVDPLIALRYE